MRPFLFTIVTVVLTSTAHSCLGAGLEKSLPTVLEQAVTHKRVNAPRGPVIVGAFNGNAQQDLSAGAGLRKLVIDHLKKMNVEVARRGKHPILSGEYEFVSDDRAGLDLNLYVSDRDGRRVQSYAERISYRDDASTVLDIAAPSGVVYHPDDTTRKKETKVKMAVTKPQIHVERNTARAVQGSYGVALLVDEHPCSMENDEGYAYVTIHRGTSYKIQLTNHTKYDAVVFVSIDGLSVFAFSEERGKPGGYLVPAGGKQVIKGWFVNRNRADEFVVGSFAESAAAQQLGSSADAGVIVVKFCVAWPKGQTPPPGERLPLVSRSADGTKRGDPVEQKLKPVPRDVGDIREVVSLRYGS